MSFEEDMQAFVMKAYARTEMVYDAVNEHIFRSITIGSVVTGAPGQPIKSGALIKSWKQVDRGTLTETISDSPYAEIIEDNRRGAQLRSKVGGFHSVKMTRLGFNRIVAHELKGVKAKTAGRIVQTRSRTGRFGTWDSRSITRGR